MTKPTLVQSLLNLPSQTYNNADTKPKREYYSTKQEMLRIAANAQADAGQMPLPRGRWDGGATVGNDLPISATVMTKRADPTLSAAFQPSTLARTQYRSSGPHPEDDEDDSDLEVFFTPNTSPRTSMASSVATITFPATRKPSRRSLTNGNADSYQPLQLPVDQKVSKTPATGPFAAVPSTRTPSTSTSQSTRARHALSSSSSLSSTSLDGHSVFSDFIGSGESTLLTTPYQSDSGDATPRAKGKSKPTKVDNVGNGTSPTANEKSRGHQNSNEDRVKDVKKLPPSTDSPNSRTAPRSEKPSASSSGTDRPTKKVSKPQTSNQLDAGSNIDADKRTPSSTSRAAKGKEREHSNEEKEKKPTSRVASQGTSSPHAQTVSSTKTYVPPKQPHTFSAFASIPDPPQPAAAAPVVSKKPAPPTNGHVPSKPSATSSNTSKPSSISSNMPKPSSTSSNTPKPSPVSSNSTKAPTAMTVHPEMPPAPSLLSPSNDTYIPTYTYSSGNPHHKASSTTHNGNGNGNSKPTTFTSTTQRKKPAVYKPPPSTMMGMDALLEEDEDGPLTPRMESRTIEGQDGWNWEGSSEGSGRQAGGTPGSGSGSMQDVEGGGTNRSRSLRHTTPEHIRHRRSRSLDNDNDSSSSSSTTRTRQQPKTLSAEVNALVQGFVSPGERPSKGTQGYTSLVLPRAPPPVSSSGQVKPLKNKDGLGGGWLSPLSLSAEGKIDLTKSGVAQTTMATVEVVRGLGLKARGFGFGLGFVRRRSSSGSGPRRGRGHGPAPLPLPSDAMNGQSGSVPASGGGWGESSPLGFTSYRAPPNYVPSGGVLVQVWAVGVDGVDGRLVGVRFGNGEVGRSEDDDLDAEVLQTDREEMTEDEGRGGGGDETEREDGDDDAQETETETETQVQTQTTPKKGGFAALGRSLSLRLSRGGSAKQKAGGAKQGSGVQRSASAVVTASPSSGSKSAARGQSEPPQEPSTPTPQTPPQPNGHKRSLSFSLKRSNTAASHASTLASVASSSASPGGGGSGNGKQQKKKNLKKNRDPPKQTRPDVGYIPGRSFVGRVLECGWDVRDEVVRKGEWVVGLLDVRKGGALAEFIVVDRHRVHRVPQPKGGSAANPVWAASPTSASSGYAQSPTLTLEELALLPLCGLPAYRAVRTFMFAFSSIRDGPSSPSTADRHGLDFVGNVMNTSTPSLSSPGGKSRRGTLPEHDIDRRRRVLVLRGHDGVGAMAVQMLAERGWKVSVHVPCSAMPADASPEVVDYFMQITEERARAWGADEIIHDDSMVGDDGRAAAVRLMDMIREDGDVFDAILDTVGGKDVREAGERLLRSPGSSSSGAASPRDGSSTPVKSPTASKRREPGQFTTLVGDAPERVIPTAGDNFRAGLRSLRLGGNDSATNGTGNGGNKSSEDSGSGKVGYAWISVAQDVDWEGVDVGESLGTVVRMALEDGLRPVVEDMDVKWKVPRGVPRAVPFEYTPNVFVDNGPLRDGGTVVVKIAE